MSHKQSLIKFPSDSQSPSENPNLLIALFHAILWLAVKYNLS